MVRFKDCDIGDIFSKLCFTSPHWLNDSITRTAVVSAGCAPVLVIQRNLAESGVKMCNDYFGTNISAVLVLMFGPSLSLTVFHLKEQKLRMGSFLCDNLKLF